LALFQQYFFCKKQQKQRYQIWFWGLLAFSSDFDGLLHKIGQKWSLWAGSTATQFRKIPSKQKNLSIQIIAKEMILVTTHWNKKDAN
jgi:hypothetical protein